MRVAKAFQVSPKKEARVSRKPRVVSLVAGAGLFLFGLLCSFYLTFPDAVLKQRLVYELESRLPIQVDLDKANLQPLLTLAGEGMQIRSPGQPDVLAGLDTFHVSPLWVALLSGDPGFQSEISSSTGDLSFSWQRSGALVLSATAWPFDIPLATTPKLRFSGKVSTADVTTSAPLQSATESRVDMTLNQVNVNGLEALTADPAGLRLGEISLQMTGQGTSFTIARLQTNGGDLVVSGEGTLMLVPAKPQNSRINLNLSVRAGNQADPTLASLLELVGTQQPDGVRKIRLTGTLAKPIVR